MARSYALMIFIVGFFMAALALLSSHVPYGAPSWDWAQASGCVAIGFIGALCLLMIDRYMEAH